MQDEKRADETVGKALERMVGGYDPLDFAADAGGTEALDVERIETAMLEASERNAVEAREGLGVERSSTRTSSGDGRWNGAPGIGDGQRERRVPDTARSPPERRRDAVR